MNLKNGYQTYKIILSRKFQRTAKVLKRRHYKGKRSQEIFTKFISQIVKSLRDNPFPLGSEPENIPKSFKGSRELEFQKYSFTMPNSEGASGQGRLMYLVDREKYTVELVWIYTHEEFPKRPSDKDLKQVLEEIQQAREQREHEEVENPENQPEQEETGN